MWRLNLNTDKSECSIYLHSLPYSTNCCKHHQDKGLRIRCLLQEKNYCHGICFTVDLHKRQFSPDFHLSCTDSESLCEALSSCNPQTTSIRQCISSISSSIFIKWVPGHPNIPGNNLADRAVKEATTIESDTIYPTSISCSFYVINKLFRDNPPSHAQTSKIYQHCKTSIDLLQILFIYLFIYLFYLIRYLQTIRRIVHRLIYIKAAEMIY